MFNKLSKFVVATVFTALLIIPQFAAAETEAPVKKITEMLYPTVMVDLSDGQGSGTVVFSGKRNHESWKDEKVWTLVLTNHHVVASAVSIEEEFDPVKKAVEYEIIRGYKGE